MSEQTPIGRPADAGHAERMDALLPLFEQVKPALLRFVEGLIRDARNCGRAIRCEAEDVAQDVFLDVSESEKFDLNKPYAKGYFFEAARNRIANLIRSLDSKVISLTTEPDAPTAFSDPKGEEAPALLMRDEVCEVVQCAVKSARLSERERKAVTLYYIDELGGYAVIAAAIRTTVKALTGLLARGRAKLREDLERSSISLAGREPDPE